MVEGRLRSLEKNVERQSLGDRLTGVDFPMAFAVLLLFFSLAGLALTFVASAYYQQDSIDRLISFSAVDPPGPMRPEMYPDPIGVHFFGDFLLPLRHAELQAPYDSPGVMTAVYPLFAVLVIAALNLVPYTLAVILFLMVSVAVVLIPLYLLLDSRPVVERLLLVGPVLLAAPLIHMVDRGNLQGLVVGAALFGMMALLRSNHGVAGFWFGIAAAMKAYPVLLLLLLVRERAWKGLWVAIGTGATASVVSAFAFEGGAVHNLLSFLRATTYFRTSEVHHLTNFNESFKGLFASVTVLGPSLLEGVAQWGMVNYGVIFVAFGVLLSISAIIRATSLLSATTYLCVVSAIGMEISRIYNPLFFFLVIAVIYAGHVERDLTTFIVIGLLAVYLAPKWMLIGEQRIHLATVANPLLAGAMVFVLGIRDLWRLLVKRESRLSPSDDLNHSRVMCR